MMKNSLIKLVDRGAIISDCQTYRYLLWREFAEGNGTCAFIGLNPSTADATKDDPTIRRCMGFAQDWGFKRLEMINLFAVRTKSPLVMKKHLNPVGPENDKTILEVCLKAELVVAAWGSNGNHLDRNALMYQFLKGHAAKLNWIRTFECFGVNANGQPKHPLYQKKCAQSDLKRYGTIY